MKKENGILDKIEKKVCFKYIIAVLLACVFALAFACGCGGSSDKNTGSDNTENNGNNENGSDKDDTETDKSAIFVMDHETYCSALPKNGVIPDNKIQIGYVFNAIEWCDPQNPLQSDCAALVDKEISLDKADFEVDFSFGHFFGQMYTFSCLRNYLEQEYEIRIYCYGNDNDIELKTYRDRIFSEKYSTAVVSPDFYVGYANNDNLQYARAFAHSEKLTIPTSIFEREEGTVRIGFRTYNPLTQSPAYFGSLSFNYKIDNGKAFTQNGCVLEFVR